MISDTKLTALARYDKGIVQSDCLLTEEGYIKGRAIVTRCGVFLYKNADGTIRKELRHPDEVFIEESMQSIKLIPVVDGHPPERLVTAENSKKLAVGFTGETVEQEPPYIIANLVITDKAIVEKIKSKKRNELSLGYTVDLVHQPGTYYGEPYDYIQKNIRYNHLALVDEARAGPEARIALDGNDAILITEEDTNMAGKKARKVKIDTQEYMMDEDAANSIEALYEKHQALEAKLAMVMSQLEKAMAERDAAKESETSENEISETDEIGPNGKEEQDPVDNYGMQSSVRDYQKPTHMQEHVVSAPKNEHYPNDLPHIPKVDAKDIQLQVKARVKLEKMSERYLDKNTLNRLDSMTDIQIKSALIKTLQKQAILEGKSDNYINARFDAIVETLPRPKVDATPSRYDGSVEKDQADAKAARQNMIQRQKDAYKQGRK